MDGKWARSGIEHDKKCTTTGLRMDQIFAQSRPELQGINCTKTALDFDQTRSGL